MPYRRAAAAALVVTAFVGAACSNSKSPGSTGSSTSGSSATSTNDVGVSPTEIRVAQVVSITGPNASGEVGFEKGFEAYVEALNDRGGVNGRKIKITSTRDDVSDAARNASEFQSAVEQENDFLMLDSAGNFGAADYAIQHNIPVIGTAYVDDWYKSDIFFGAPQGGTWKAADPTNRPQPPAAGAAIHGYIMGKLGLHKMGTFGYTVTSSANSARQSCDNAKILGIDCVYTDTSLSFGFTDLGASIAKIKSSGADYFYAAMDPGGCVTILRGLKRAGMDNAYLYCATGYGQDVTALNFDALDHAFFETSTAPFESNAPEMKTFLTELAARKPGTKPSVTVLNGWISGIFLEDVLKAMGRNNITRQRFIDTARHDPAFASWDAHGLLTATDWTHNRFDEITAGTYKPPACGGYLLRVDEKTKTYVQVGEKPKLCLGDVTTAAALKAALQKDTSSLDIPS